MQSVLILSIALCASDCLGFGAMLGCCDKIINDGPPIIRQETDTFDTDGSNLGSNWSVVTSEASIYVSNHNVYSPSVTRRGQYWSAGAAWPDDQCSQTEITGLSLSSGRPSGVLVRVSSSAESFYQGNAYTATTAQSANIKVYYADGSNTTLVTAPEVIPWAIGDTLKLCVSGTDLYLYRNNTIITSAVGQATAHSSGSPGIYYYAPPEATMSNWVGTGY